MNTKKIREIPFDGESAAINSIYNKTDETSQIANLQYDIITFNETKLDDTVPLSYTANNHYNSIRLNRNRNGGGLLVMIKNSYLIINQKIHNEYEIISFQLQIKNQLCNFIMAYKSPTVNNKIIFRLY